MEYIKEMRVLLVCLGNICRSPLAHGVAAHLKTRFESKIQFDSCGMYGEPEGQPTHTGSRQILKDRLNISFSKDSRHWRPDDYANFDLILCMDGSNFRDVMAELEGGDVLHKVKMFRDYDPEGRGDVPDPYYCGGFDKVYDTVYRTLVNMFELEKMGKLV